MRQRFFLIALLAIGLALPFTGKAAAADLPFTRKAAAVDCGICGGYTDYYAVQPELVVRRPFVVLEPYYLSEYVPCGDGSVVNQGQYHTNAALIAQPRCFDGYAPTRYAPVHRMFYK